jgi:RNA polymerase sigma-70 factor (ECF subfamily)
MHEPDVLVAECPRSTAAAPSDDVQLVARLRAGDETAYEEVMRLYGGRLHAVARRLLGNDDDAWDAVQMALLSAFQSLDTFRGQSRLSTWLHRIVVNAALMKIRSRTRAREEPLGALLPAFMEDGRHAEPVSRSALPDELLAQREVRTAVRRCIERLPEPHRAVLVMRDIGDARRDAQRGQDSPASCPPGARRAAAAGIRRRTPGLAPVRAAPRDNALQGAASAAPERRLPR